MALSFRIQLRLIQYLFMGCLLSLSEGCVSSILSQRGAYLRAYHTGALDHAEQQLDSLMTVTNVKENYRESKEASWILLDQATLHFAMGKTAIAIEEYAEALESLDYYGQDLTIEQYQQLLIQDEMAAYQADDFEQVLARVYFAFALLHEGEESNAYALLRQAEDYQQSKSQWYADIPFTRHYRFGHNALSKYLFALLLQRRGDESNARILYRQTQQLTPHVIEVPEVDSESATVLVVCHNGNAPYKISTTCPASVASACALECLLATQDIDPAWSTLTGIPVPTLCDWPDASPLPTIAQLADLRHPLKTIYHVRQAASEQLEQKMPVLAARGVARLLMRRTAVGYLDRKNPTLGMISDVTMFVMNAHTHADTRSWTNLPAVIDMTRFDVMPGCYPLRLQICEEECLYTYDYTLQLRSHDLCVIHIFNIHPGVRQILIPVRYLKKRK
jgi:uncharacterized protein